MKPSQIEGDSKFKVNFKFKYRYEVRLNTKSRILEKEKKKISKKNHKSSQKYGYQEISSTVDCSPQTLVCDSFNLIYNPYIEKDTRHFLKVLFKPTEMNKNLIEGFDLYVRFIF